MSYANGHSTVTRRDLEMAICELQAEQSRLNHAGNHSKLLFGLIRDLKKQLERLK